MATIDVHNLKGAKVGTLDLADEVFGAVNEDLLWEAVKHYRAGQRAGTHKTKARWEVAGSGKKLWKQKGTGRARIGSVRSPLWRHGGTVHGPVPRSYDYSFPKKKLLGALRSALAAKFADGKLVVVNAFDVKETKTKAFAASLGKLKVEGTTLLVDSSNAENKNLQLSSRNIDGLDLVRGNEVHPYHLMRHKHVIFAQPALEKLQDSLRKTASRRDHAEPAPEKKKPARRSRKAEVA
ncbi:MAG TPA: 50S ribosomal protein L4 [Terriglobales bacterium]|nr:50S ribosomal protein L4 [Terriglobales bacterium]